MSAVPSTTGSNSSATSPATQASKSALGSLSDNFTNFLSLLMTQLQNQDPTSPLDANQFTTQLVQFTSVEQQIATNSSLTQLIQLTQASQMEQSASMIGRPVTVSSSQLALQDGKAKINFRTASPKSVAIAILDSAGAEVQTTTLTTTAGTNSWTWDGRSATGTNMPDGPYKVTVSSVASDGSKSEIPFTVTGTATSIQNTGGTVQVELGGLTLPFSAVQSMGT